MKKTLKLFALLTVFVGLLATGCSKEETDPRDQYVGTWQSTQTGSLIMYYDGQPIVTMPINETSSIVISKSGQNNLNIGGQIFTLNGNQLTASPESMNITEDGMNLVGTAIYSGQASPNLIVINSTITGSWSGAGAAGNMSGSTTWTLTKQ